MCVFVCVCAGKHESSSWHFESECLRVHACTRQQVCMLPHECATVSHHTPQKQPPSHASSFYRRCRCRSIRCDVTLQSANGHRAVSGGERGCDEAVRHGVSANRISSWGDERQSRLRWRVILVMFLTHTLNAFSSSSFCICIVVPFFFFPHAPISFIFLLF